MFENISKLEFDEKKFIHAMFSGEGEKIQFVDVIDPTIKGVEYWMGDVEEMMKMSVRAALLKSIKDYKNTERKKWVLNHPG